MRYPGILILGLTLIACTENGGGDPAGSTALVDNTGSPPPEWGTGTQCPKGSKHAVYYFDLKECN